MKAPEAAIESAEATSAAREESTGLPWFRSWGGVYLFAFGCFVLYVVLLTVFSWAFS